MTPLKRPWCWERLKAGREGGDRGWDGWMASPTQLTIIWVNSGSWWWTGRFGVLQFMGSQRVRHDWASELNWTLKVATIAPTATVRFISSFYLLRRLNGKDPDSGKDWEHEKKGITEDETVGWHRRLNGHEFEQTLGDSEGQGSLALQRVGHDWVTEQQLGKHLLRSWVISQIFSSSEILS